MAPPICVREKRGRNSETQKMKRRTGPGSVIKRRISVDGVSWASLTKGEWVEVDCGEFVNHRGVVDDVTDDGSVLWLWREDGRGRTLYLQSDGHAVHRTNPPNALVSYTLDSPIYLKAKPEYDSG